VLEQDVLDGAWAQLEAKHPELILQGGRRPQGPLRELGNRAMPLQHPGHSPCLAAAVTCLRAVGGVQSADPTNGGAGGQSPASRVGFGTAGWGLGAGDAGTADWAVCGYADGTVSVLSCGGGDACRVLCALSLPDALRRECSDWLLAQLDPHVLTGDWAVGSTMVHPRCRQFRSRIQAFIDG
jgi:hypothetical protein